MDKPRIPVDFNELDDPMPISKTAEVVDTAGNHITLTEGLPVFICEQDYDEFDRRDDLIADGVAVLNPNPNSVARWCCKIDSRGIRHQSDEPGFTQQALTAGEKRRIIYGKIEKWVALIGKKDNGIVQGALETYIKILGDIED